MKIFKFILSIILLTSCIESRNQNIIASITDSSKIESKKNDKVQDKFFWEFDVTKKYPKKELYIQDIADVEYLPIETNDSMLWWGRDICYFDKDFIIAANNDAGILFHERKTGKALHSFHRKGNGPGEYTSLYKAKFDRNCNEVFVYDIMRKKYYIYDDKGNFKRSFHTRSKLRPDRFFILNEKELVEYNSENTYTRRSKSTGEILETFTFGSDPKFGLTFKKNDMWYNAGVNKFIKDKDGYILAAFASDTTWLLTSDAGLEPIGVRKPSISTMEIPIFLLPGKNTSNYYFMYTIEKSETYPLEMYMLDKKDNQIYWMETMLKNRDYIDYEVHLDISGPISEADIPTDLSIISMGAEGLIKAYNEGKLSGELKEIAANLKEDDNPVLMIMKFKE